jgi:phage gp29-like protein
VPGGVVTLPPDVPTEKIPEYQAAAKDVAEGGSGALPHGSTYTANDGPRGTDPFESYLKHIAEQLILAGTGGKLTMLAESGSGTLAGSAHADAFQQIARGDARAINELFQRAIDAEALDAQFPGQPHLAYFEMNFREEVDAGEMADLLSKLALAGLQADPEEVGEKLGLKLTLKPTTGAAATAAADPENPADPEAEAEAKRERAQATAALKNRAPGATDADFLSKAQALLSGARKADFAPIAKRLEELLALPDDQLDEGLRQLNADLPKLLPKGDSEGVKAWSAVLGIALAHGITDEEVAA